MGNLETLVTDEFNRRIANNEAFTALDIVNWIRSQGINCYYSDVVAILTKITVLPAQLSLITVNNGVSNILAKLYHPATFNTDLYTDRNQTAIPNVVDSSTTLTTSDDSALITVPDTAMVVANTRIQPVSNTGVYITKTTLREQHFEGSEFNLTFTANSIILTQASVGFRKPTSNGKLLVTRNELRLVDLFHQEVSIEFTDTTIEIKGV